MIITCPLFCVCDQIEGSNLWIRPRIILTKRDPHQKWFLYMEPMPGPIQNVTISILGN
jgi:hypothetical protein